MVLTGVALERAVRPLGLGTQFHLIASSGSAAVQNRSDDCVLFTRNTIDAVMANRGVW
jgi:hypothetical protein